MVDKLWLIQKIVNHKDPNHEEEDPQNDIDREVINKLIDQYEKESLEAFNQMTRETLTHNMTSIMKQIKEVILNSPRPLEKYYLMYSSKVKCPELFYGDESVYKSKTREGYTLLMEFHDIDEFNSKYQDILDYVIDRKMAEGDIH